MREKSLPESVLCIRRVIFITLKCSLLIYSFKELCLCKYWKADSHSFGGRKQSDSEVYVSQSSGMGATYGFLSANTFFPYLLYFSFFHLETFLESGGIHWQLPTCWTLLLEEILGFSKQQDGTKKAHVSRRNLDLTPQKTFLKFLVKWSGILFTYDRGKLSLLPPIKPQCTILVFALYSFYWASIVS